MHRAFHLYGAIRAQATGQFIFRLDHRLASGVSRAFAPKSLATAVARQLTEHAVERAVLQHENCGVFATPLPRLSQGRDTTPLRCSAAMLPKC